MEKEKLLAEEKLYVSKAYSSSIMERIRNEIINNKRTLLGKFDYPGRVSLSIEPKVFMDHKIMLDHSFGELVGKTLSDVELISQDGVISEIIFKLESGEVYKMYHEQDCCEDVFVEDITDDVKLLVGKQILQAYKTSNADGPAPEFAKSYTWTFYTISTFDISITIRWLGESNGYYSESVSFKRIK